MDPSRRMKSCDSSPCFNKMMLQTPFLRPGAKFSAAQSKGRGFRHICGRLFATLVACSTGIPVYDSQCGFKLVRRKCYEAVRSRLREKKFAFDVELLVALSQSGATIIEVPIDWSDVPGSKLHFLRDTAQMFAAVIGMRMKDHRGRSKYPQMAADGEKDRQTHANDGA